MKAENCYVGMRIYVPSKFWGKVDFKGRRGTVVFIDGRDIGVDFDDEISSFTHEIGHTCAGKARNGHGYFGDIRDVEPLVDEFVPQIGQRVVVKDTFDNNPSFAGRVGTIVEIRYYSNPGSCVGVDFDDAFAEGHDCRGKARNGHGYYGFVRELKLISSAIDLDNIEITFEDVFGGDET